MTNFDIISDLRSIWRNRYSKYLPKQHFVSIKKYKYFCVKVSTKFISSLSFLVVIGKFKIIHHYRSLQLRLVKQKLFKIFMTDISAVLVVTANKWVHIIEWKIRVLHSFPSDAELLWETVSARRLFLINFLWIAPYPSLCVNFCINLLPWRVSFSTRPHLILFIFLTNSELLRTLAPHLTQLSCIFML